VLQAMRISVPVLVTVLFLLSPRPEAQEVHLSEATKALHQLFASEWDYEMEQHPTRASRLGDRRWNDRWEDLSLAAIETRHRHNIGVLNKLKAIDRAALSPGDQLNYDLFQKRYEERIEGFRYRWYLIPLNQRGGIQTANELADALPFDRVKDYEDWLARLRSFPTYMEQTIALMREGLKTRMVLPRVVLERIPSQIQHQIVGDPKASPFYKPFQRFPESISAADRSRLLRDAEHVITASVIPAFRQLNESFIKDYLPASYSQVGIWQLPQGMAMYEFFARLHTTTGLTPKEIHEIGLREVRRIRAEMQAVIDKVGFSGSFAEFLAFLRTDPRFYYETPQELIEAYRALTRRIDPLLVRVFNTLPRTPYGVEPIPDTIAPDTTTAYYRPPAADGSRAGTYFVNLYKPEARPKYEMMVLSLHEAVPGHHLQIALAMEQREMPNFRRYGGYTAFVEGWALYAESLGDDLGLYDDPYSKFGQLTYEMWRAARLVLDTGIHHFRWDRQKAIRFLLENTAKQELDVVNEVDRYITWPGQALAYKIGQLKIKELRGQARQALGDGFDLREFHEVVLKAGALPLDILERNVEEWVAAKKLRK